MVKWWLAFEATVTLIFLVCGSVFTIWLAISIISSLLAARKQRRLWNHKVGGDAK